MTLDARILVVVLLVCILGGCGREVEIDGLQLSSPGTALRGRFGAPASDLLVRRTSIERGDGGWDLSRIRASAHAEGDQSATTPGEASDVLRVASNAREAILLSFAARAPLRVFEEGADGQSEAIEGTVSYSREGGRSYWTVAEGSAGFEEWLDIEAGRAYAGRVLARWRIDGHRVREVEATGGVHVLDDAGRPVVYVSAPEAWTGSGVRLVPTLAVEEDAIVLRADAGGEAVLVDPIWVPTGTMMTGRGEFFQGYGAIRLVSGRVLIAGGAVGATALSSAEIYDPTTEVWTATGSMTTARFQHSTTLLADGRVLVVGGNDSSDYLASVEVYDPMTGLWSVASPLAVGRCQHTATLLADGRVMVVGGYEAGTVTRLATAVIYDPTTGTWSSTGSMTTGRGRHTATRLLDGRVLVAGGETSVGPETFLSRAEVYDPTTGAWAMTGSLATGRMVHTATRLLDGRVLVAGGQGASGYLASAELYEPTTGNWSPAAALAAARGYPTATPLDDGRVLVVGGINSLVGYVAGAEAYAPLLGTWSNAGSLATGRLLHTATRLADGRVLVAGGEESGDLSSSELWLDTACGNGLVEAGEQCDGGDCCTSACVFRPNTHVCRADLGACDVEERCSGSDASCPSDGAEPVGTACGAAPVGVCDAQDSCSGVVGSAATCTARYAPSSTVCRTDEGTCDREERCTGASTLCPPDAAEPVGTPCGGAPMGICDAQDTCVGTLGASATCMAAYAPATTVCRAVGGACDVEERCTGSGTMCPGDTGMPGCCVNDSDCPEVDGDLCTMPSCDSSTRMCIERAVSCDDGDACTVDACETSGTCSHTDLACDDRDVCTMDRCTSDGRCANEPIAGCTTPDAGPTDAGSLGRDAGHADAGSGPSPVDAGLAFDASNDASMDAAGAASDSSTTPMVDAGRAESGGTSCSCAAPGVRGRDADGELTSVLATLLLLVLRTRRGQRAVRNGARGRRRGAR
jgi:N-acetylneuraminic acid mutarotase